MNDRFLAVLSASCIFLAPLVSFAQGLSPAPAAPAARLSPAPASTQSADFIVAVVNSEPITNSEVRREVLRVVRQLTQQKQTVPTYQVLSQQLLDALINQKIQLQLAHDLGVRTSSAAIDEAEQGVAMQSRLDLPTLHQKLAEDGITVSQFREQLSKQIVLALLREQEVDRWVQVSDVEADQYLREQERNADSTHLQINLAQILVALPDKATPEQIAALQAKAQNLHAQLLAGADFATLARDASDAPERANDGQLGLRDSDRYPALFVAATRQLKVGDISEVLRSDAGWHILKVLQKVNPNLPTDTMTQTHVRHILLRVGAQMTQSQALDKLADLKQRVATGQADFTTLARAYSEDTTADKGGDLGWANPDTFVTEFETAMNRLEAGQVSDPVVTRFGVHLIQVEARRQVPLTAVQRRDSVRAMLLEKKRQDAYINWRKNLRQQSYIEMREAPRR